VSTKTLQDVYLCMDIQRMGVMNSQFIRQSIWHLLNLIAIILSAGILHGQTISTGDDYLKYPWAGGMNSCQFAMIDMDLDGNKDPLVFDRHGNRLLPFVYLPDQGDYRFRPDLFRYFPEMHDWMVLKDYNYDGREDIFTYENGGIRVFRNISEEHLRFELVTNQLQSYYFSGYVNLFLTSVDYPAIEDVDLDGDLDILTFFGLGSYVQYHKNLSMEKYGHADSLDYRLEEQCWGGFKESESSNILELNVICPYKEPAPFAMTPGDRHTGSTLLITHLNGDQLPDLILGDVGYPGLISLINGGTSDTARMISQDTLFPGLPDPVRLFSFPAAFLQDANHDGQDELIISPFDPQLAVAENTRSVWLYNNIGTNGSPVFSLQTKSFLQEEMLDFGSSSRPVLADVDGDGLLDLLVGNEGYYDSSYYALGLLHTVYHSSIAYYRNTGSANSPLFSFITNDLGDLSKYGLKGLSPTQADLNGDAIPDLLPGQEDGSLIYLERIPSSALLPEYQIPVFQYQQIDVGLSSAPQLFDLDRDGLSDLVIGERGGNLNYYRNSGTAENPVFTFVTDSLGKVNVTDYSLSWDGFSVPCFFRLLSGETRLLAGSEQGKVFHFKDIDSHLQEAFTEVQDLKELLDTTLYKPLTGWRSAPAIANLDADSKMELIAGNYSGGLFFYSASASPPVLPYIHEIPSSTLTVSLFPNPCRSVFQITFPQLLSGSIRCYSIAGNMIYSKDFRDLQHITVSTSDWPSGLIICQVIIPDKIIRVEKLMHLE